MRQGASTASCIFIYAYYSLREDSLHQNILNVLWGGYKLNYGGPCLKIKIFSP